MAAPQKAQRYPTTADRGTVDPKTHRSVVGSLTEPLDVTRGTLGEPPLPFRIARPFVPAISGWASTASQYDPPTLDGGDKSGIVMHSTIPSGHNATRRTQRQTARMQSRLDPTASRSNVPALFVPTAPITR